MLRKCQTCKLDKPATEFHKSKRNAGGFKPDCKACRKIEAVVYRKKYPEKVTANSKKWYANNPEKRKAVYRNKGWRDAGIDMDYDRYLLMLEERGHRCDICKKHDSEFEQALAVDHDHKTGLVRGLLCNECNTVLGKMNDDPDLLRKAAGYLEKQ
jgi:hypothetical protein